MNNISLMTIDELHEELKNHCTAFVSSYHCYDEDVGSKRIIAKRLTFESHKAQTLGLSSRLYWWLKRRSSFNAISSTKHVDDPSSDEVSDDVSTIIEELDKRCPLFLLACVRNNNSILLHQKDSGHGQSLGNAYELNEWVNSMPH
jgi:hypothetical protein